MDIGRRISGSGLCRALVKSLMFITQIAYSQKMTTFMLGSRDMLTDQKSQKQADTLLPTARYDYERV